MIWPLLALAAYLVLSCSIDSVNYNFASCRLLVVLIRQALDAAGLAATITVVMWAGRCDGHQGLRRASQFIRFKGNIPRELTGFCQDMCYFPKIK